MHATHSTRARAGLGRSLARLAAVLALLGVIVATVRGLGLRVQHTRSLPRGIYRDVAGRPERGALGVWCLPEATARWARARGYLRAGGCPGRAEAIGKAVLAVGGDVVRFGPEGLTINGNPVPNTRPVVRDVHGVPVPHAAFGTYALPRGWVWLWSPYAARSFDSRYFGPVRTDALVSLVRPVWTTR